MSVIDDIKYLKNDFYNAKQTNKQIYALHKNL
jgi:hypothetical protein